MTAALPPTDPEITVFIEDGAIFFYDTCLIHATWSRSRDNYGEVIARVVPNRDLRVTYTWHSLWVRTASQGVAVSDTGPVTIDINAPTHNLPGISLRAVELITADAMLKVAEHLLCRQTL